ncbi:hypothetical protein N752_01580 [Desulforamulus aquiferis]|nr:tyrosine-type recombinase/integrase [Desulforamulus aquiferis]RYD06844.1 hypothetical protein N752_01580 [Desulforamulus aquiferis]
MSDDWSQRTLEYHLENLAVFKKFLVSNTGTITNITKNTLENFKTSMRNAGRKKNTINGRVKTLRVFFRVLYNEGYIDNNPAESFKVIKGGKKSEIIPFTTEQLKAILAQPNQKVFVGLRDYMIMQLLTDTGIRLQELVDIRICDINIDKKSVFIKQGHGDESRMVYFGIKTANTIRSI